MKGKKAVRFMTAVLAAVLAAFVAVACGGEQKGAHEHTWGEWTLSQPATLDEAVTATRKCTENDGGEETKTLAALSDASFWTKATVTPAGHASKGTDTYTNAEYGTVTMTTPETGHTWGEWTLSQPATTDEAVTATRECTANDGGEDSKQLPALSDGEFWDKTAGTPVHGVSTDTYTNAEYGTVTMTVGTVQHTWGEWTLSQPETLDEPVTATRECTENDGGKETKTLSALSDSDFWTKATGTPATHATEGTDTYTNAEYGTVTMTTPALGHNWSAWTVENVPTNTTDKITAKRICLDGDGNANSDGGEETKELPAFGDSEFWTEGDKVTAANYNTAAYTEYSNAEYGLTLRMITANKLVAAYDNQTYHSVSIGEPDPDEIQEGVASGKTPYNGKNGLSLFQLNLSWSAAELTLDANGEGNGTAAPFTNGSHITFRMKDPASDNGEMTITYTKEGEEKHEYVAYLDKESKYIIMFQDKDIVILLPDSICDHGNSPLFSVWGAADEYRMAISYTPDEGTAQTFYIVRKAVSEEVYFGVTFTDLNGGDVNAEDAYGSPCVYVKKGADQLAAYGFDADESKMKELDGLEGSYTAAAESDLTGELKLDGLGKFTVGDLDGKYTIEDPAAKKLLCLVTTEGDSRNKTYSVTLSDGTYTAEEKPVILHFDMNGNDAATKPDDASVPYGFEYGDLPTPEPTADKVFDRWTYDAAGEQELESPFVPTEEKTLYAQWANRVDVNVHLHKKGEDDTVTQLVLAEGKSDVYAELRKLEGELTLVDEDNLVYFVGWSMTANGDTFDVSEELPASADWNGKDVHAVWKDFPAYYGNYYGIDLDNKGYEAVSVYSSYNIKISYDGKITGKYTGEVTNYDEATGIITAKSDRGATNYLFFDAESHTIAVQYGGITSNELDDDTEVYNVKAETGSTVPTFGIQCVRGNGSGLQDTYATLSDFKLGDNKFVFTYYKSVFTVTVTDGFGTVITDLATLDNCTSIIIKKGDEVLFSWGVTDPSKTLKTTTETETLNEYRGTYAYGSGEALGTIALDGSVSIKLHTEGEAVTGTYTLEGNMASAFAGGAYYDITLTKDGATYAAVKPMVSVKLTTSATESLYDGGTQSKNKNIQFELDAPNVDGYLFRGWFSDPDYAHELDKSSDDAKYVFTPTEDCSLYAKLIKKVTITVHLEGGATLPEDALGAKGTIDTFGQGEEVTIVRPAKAGSKFAGWYLDDGLQTPWGETAQDGSTTVKLGTDKTAFDLYPKWDDPPAYSGEYNLYRYDSTSANGATDNGDTFSSTITIDTEGEIKAASSTTYPFTMDLKVTAFEGNKMTFLRVGYTTTFTAYFDSTNKIIVFIARGTGYSDIVLLVPASLANGAAITGAQWNSGKVHVIDIKKSDNTHIGIYLNSEEEPYFNVSFTDCNGGAITDLGSAHTAESLWVMQSEEKIASFGFNGTTMVATDGFEGTYTLSGEDKYSLGSSLELNGISTAKFGDKQGVYSVVDKDTKKLGVTVENVYYDVTLDGENYTIDKPMVDITFSSEQGFVYDGGTWDSEQNLNINIEIKIPALSNTAEYVFRGWYAVFADGEYSAPLDTDADGKYTFIPTEATTLYAKWLEKVTITVHYDNGLGDETFEYGKGEAGFPTHPAYTNGKVWNGWYKDPSCSEGQEWEDGTAVTGNIELYVKWLDASPLYGEWVGAEIWGSTDGGGTTYGGTGAKKANVTAEGVVSGDCPSGTVSDYDAETGIFKIGSNKYGAADLKNNVMMVNCYTGPIGYDYYIYINKTVTTSFLTSSSAACYWNGSEKGSAKLAEMKFADGSTMKIFILDGRLWGNITFEATSVDTTEVTPANAYNKAKTLIIKDSDGNVIAKFVRGEKGLERTDGYEGEYTVTDGTITLDGKGGITATLSSSEKSGTYTAAADGDYTFDVYLEDGSEYYELTIEVAGSGSATLTKAMVTVQFTISGSTSNLTQEAKSYNKNVPVLLPVPATETETITGWFTDAACEHPVELVDGKYTPTADVTLYAKAAVKVTVTIDYGEYSGTVPNVTLPIPSGTVPDLTPYIPPAQGDFVFGGWYTDSGYATQYTGEPITENKTIYCKWINQPFEVEIMAASGGVQWVETEGVYRASVGRKTTVAAMIKITFKASGTFSFEWAASFDDVYADCLVVALDHNPPHQASNKVLSRTSGSGTQPVTVEAGNVLYIEAYTDNSDGDSSDYAQVSNFKFTAG